MGVYLREYVDLFVFLIQQDLQILHLRFQDADALLEGFGVAPGKGSSAQLIAGLALKTDVRALRAARADAITTNLLAPTSITRLGYPALRARPELDDFHGKYARHGDHICGWPREGWRHGDSRSLS